MDLRKIRQDFPILQENSGRKAITYFDTACQSLRPKPVIDAINQYYLKTSACSGRSMHQLAAEVTRACDQARSAVAKFLNASRKEEIVFTRNTTEGINLVAQAWGPEHLRAGDVILLTEMEHHSNIVPWQLLAQRTGARLRFLPVQGDFKPNDILEVTITTERADDKDAQKRTAVVLVDKAKYPQVRALYRYNFNSGVVVSNLRDTRFVKVRTVADESASWTRGITTEGRSRAASPIAFAFRASFEKSSSSWTVRSNSSMTAVGV